MRLGCHQSPQVPWLPGQGQNREQSWTVYWPNLWYEIGTNTIPGSWYGGVQNVWGEEKRTRERALPKILDPSLESFWSALWWIFAEEKQSTDTWGGLKTYRTRGVSKTPFGEECHSWGFPPPSFFHPPMASSEDSLRASFHNFEGMLCPLDLWAFWKELCMLSKAPDRFCCRKFP